MADEDPSRTVYDVLDALRRRPGMFIPVPDLSHLQAFMSGLLFSKLPPGEPSVWNFSKWITARVEGISLTMPWDWLEETLGSDAALDAYFRYLDEYRACDVVEVGFAKGPFEPRFSVVAPSVDLQPRRPDIPERLIISQFAPSNVFFLGEVHLERVDQDFPFERSACAVVQRAMNKWTVKPEAWSFIQPV